MGKSFHSPSHSHIYIVVYRLLAAAIFSFFLSACSPIRIQDQPTQSDFITLNPGEHISQTFTPRFDGLTELSVYLEPERAETVKLVWELTSNPPGINPLASGSIKGESVSKAGFTTFTFSSITHSLNNDMVFYLENSSLSAIKVSLGPGDTYLNGAAGSSDTPIDAQLTFRTGYTFTNLGFGLLKEALIWAMYIGIFGIIYIVPGSAFLKLLDQKWDTRDWFEKIVLAAGVGLVIHPILILWTSLVGIRLGPLYAWLPLIFGLGTLILLSLLKRQIRTFNPGKLHFEWIDLALLIIISFIVISRFWAIRTVVIPLFGDSYQHTMITKLLLDHSGLFSDWQPYTDLVTFTYHFGFHSIAAVFSWMSKLSAPQSVLVVGQILNCIAVFSLYPIAKKIGASKIAGLVAVVIAGCLSPMPAQYVNWGRYTQLAAQATLPIFAILYIDTLQTKYLKGSQAVLSGVLLAGIALTHYRIILFAVLFFVGYHLIFLSDSSSRNKLRLSIIVISVAILLSLPWFINSFGGRLVSLFRVQLSTAPSLVRETTPVNNPTGPLDSYLPVYIWWLFGIASTAAILLRHKIGTMILLWWALIVFAANPQWLNLPGAGIITSFAAFIAAYIPAGILIGASIGWMSNYITSKALPVSIPYLNITTIGLLIIALYGASRQARILNPGQFSLVTRPDIRAANWIDSNLPADAHFVVNSFPAFYDTTVVGSDAGWWLPLLAFRSTTLPPITYVFEKDPYPGYRQSINNLVDTLRTYGTLSPEYLQALEKRGVTHLYIGQRRGSVNYDGPLSFDPKMLLSDSHFIPIYNQDRVWIFEVHP